MFITFLVAYHSCCMLPVSVAPISQRLSNIFYNLARFVAKYIQRFDFSLFPFVHWHTVQVAEMNTVQMMYEQ